MLLTPENQVLTKIKIKYDVFMTIHTIFKNSINVHLLFRVGLLSLALMPFT